MPLSDRAIKALRPSDKPTKHSDGGGLRLDVMPNGSKLWRQAYRYGGKQKLLAHGAYPAVSLADARCKRDEAKALLTGGIDPSAHAKVEKARERAKTADTFDAIADEVLAKGEREGRAGATLTKKRWVLSLVRDALSPRPIRSITAADVLAVLRPIEAKGNYETTKRARAIVGQVFRHAIATGRADTDPTLALRGALTAPTVTHRAALVDRDAFARLVRVTWDYEGSPVTRAALRLMILLYPRPGEMRLARWGEFDLGRATWTVPAERMKMRREHRKPLPTAAVAILRELHALTGHGDLAFPSLHASGRPLSENTLNAALRRLGFTKDEATSHGFRASASTLLNESGRWNPDAIEAELGHVGADAVRKAYHRALYWDERVRMAEWWATETELMVTS